MLRPTYYALLSMQSALSNAVVPQLRAVTIDIDEMNQEWTPSFFFDGELNEKMVELCTVALAEIDTGTKEPYFCNHHITRLDFPEKVPIHGKLAYLRYEPVLPPFERENKLFLLKEACIPLSVFRLDMQEALLGKVTPPLRFVSVGMDFDQKKLVAYFVYDGKISERDLRLANAAIEDSRITFPEFTMESFIERVDFPNEFESKGSHAAYLRREWECIDDELIFIRNDNTNTFG